MYERRSPSVFQHHNACVCDGKVELKVRQPVSNGTEMNWTTMHHLDRVHARSDAVEFERKW